jgi:membrane protease YdiL (CAAX protease family)
MERFARLFPFFATMVVGVAQAMAWRAQTAQGSWIALAVAWAALAAIALYLIRREEMTSDLFALVPGDVSRGIGGAAVSVLVLAAVGWLGIKFAPERAFAELRSLIFVATGVPVEWKRALAIIALAACEEIVFRGAITLFLEERFGSNRAPWVASGLYVLATVPSLRPPVILAAAVIGASTAFLVARYRRVTLAIVAHAAFAWLAVEFVLPNLWHYLLTHSGR